MLAVAVLVLVAGCAGSEETTPPTTSVETPTTAEPATTTSPATTSSSPATTANASANESLPPGLNASGVEDSAVLVEAHRSALNNSSFAFRFRSNVSVGQSSQWTRQRGTVEAGKSPLVVHSDSVRNLSGGTTRVATDLWANDTTVVVQYHRQDRTELRRYNRTGGNVADETWAHLPRADLDSQVTQSWLVELALTAGDFELDRIERRDGRRVAVLRATEAVEATNLTDLNATAVVDEEGRVHSLSLTAAYEGDDRSRIHYEFELTDVGSVAVERPMWVGAALPPTTENGTTTTTVPSGDETATPTDAETTTATATTTADSR
ncbi:DUF7537 family lipoprotein [Halorussus caseinilyticus]|uniref:DUF7537 family lipoprotein n=1 Tax=Halorussus caseinilyticus TaxID=3034025 RepID=UPI0023E86627|nr:hypothetical protein [Halorussus sp. DT72]